MLEGLRADAEKIYTGAIKACLPEKTVKDALEGFKAPRGRLVLVSIGKAAWRMANAAYGALGEKINSGAVITKYGHSEGSIGTLEIYEAAHPIPDAAGAAATERVLELTDGLTADDTVLFLISGGGSALFESTECTLGELADITRQLLFSGASINEVNAVRKHLSNVKGGRFAEHCAPAHIYAIVLSDVIGNSLDTIASGPATADKSTVQDVKSIIERYKLSIPEHAEATLFSETPKHISNAEHHIGTSVSELCAAAAELCRELGYTSMLLGDDFACEASELGHKLAALACENCDTDIPLAFIAGGETVVNVRGDGIGGRNQETALSAAEMISEKGNIAIFSVGSDGTDGPTDAAGGYVDAHTVQRFLRMEYDYKAALANNDSHTALLYSDGLIITGPTGTNVNDIAVALVRPKSELEPRKYANLERILNMKERNFEF